MKTRIAINGFGRIGRTFLRSLLLHPSATSTLEIVAINEGPIHNPQIDILFKYDSIMREFPGEVSCDATTLYVGSRNIALYAQADPQYLPWKELEIDWVIEASGFFTMHDKAALHLQAGAKKVLITAPSKNADCSIVPGVNSDLYDAKQHHVVSLASCTTNCFAAVLKALVPQVTIEQGMMTTVHAYTNTQAVLDVADADARKSRAAALNMIPTKTGAHEIIGRIFPQLQGKIETMAVRVPIPDVSFIDFTFMAAAAYTAQDLNKIMARAAEDSLCGVLAYTEKPLVSSDYLGNPHAAIVDGLLTKCNGRMNKICAWYDNEFGYSSRITDFLLHNG